jgi:hypothetical protein
MKYVFRGVTVFEYDPETKQVRVVETEENGNHFNYCKFIPEDYELIAKFFDTARHHAQGLWDTESLRDIIVN